MSYADLLRTFSERSVTPVTPRIPPEVTNKTEGNQSSNLSYPGYPEKPIRAEKTPEPKNPAGMLLKIAKTLEASPDRLRGLLDADDMQAIADGEYSLEYLLAYFRLMRSDGNQLADDEPVATIAPDNCPSHVERMKAWMPAHEALINHLMACSACYAPLSRYCIDGTDLRLGYLSAQRSDDLVRPCPKTFTSTPTSEPFNHHLQEVQSPPARAIERVKTTCASVGKGKTEPTR